MEKNGTPASPAIALASKVLPSHEDRVIFGGKKVVKCGATAAYTGEVFIDGSVRHPSVGRFATGGWGAVSVLPGPDDRPVIASYACFGDLPAFKFVDSTSCELYAFVEMLHESVPPLVVYTDCDNLVHGLTRGKIWCCGGSNIYADIWQRIWFELNEHSSNGLDEIITTKWVKAHTAAARVAEGLITVRLRSGNGWADTMAKCGSRAVMVQDSVIDRYNDMIGKQKTILGWIARSGVITGEGRAAGPDAEKPPPVVERKAERIVRINRLIERGERNNDQRDLPAPGQRHVLTNAGEGAARCPCCGITASGPKAVLALARKRCFGVRVNGDSDEAALAQAAGVDAGAHDDRETEEAAVNGAGAAGSPNEEGEGVDQAPSTPPLPPVLVVPDIPAFRPPAYARDGNAEALRIWASELKDLGHVPRHVGGVRLGCVRCGRTALLATGAAGLSIRCEGPPTSQALKRQKSLMSKNRDPLSGERLGVLHQMSL